MKQNIKGALLATAGIISWFFIMHIPQAIAAYQAGKLVGQLEYGIAVFLLILWIEWLAVPCLFDWGLKAWARVPVIIAGFFVLIPAAFFVEELEHNRWGEPATPHDPKYIDQGASGMWTPSRLKWKWVNDIWGNPTDGCYGQDNGLYSMIVKGKERTWLGIYRWLAFHNPANAFGLTSPLMTCHVPSCEITHKGNYFLSDRNPVKEGWFFVTATHRKTGKKYRGFRLVHQWSNGKVLNVSLGNKLKPEHEHEAFEPRKEYKAPTFRVQIMTSTF